MIYATIEFVDGERFMKVFMSAGHMIDYQVKHWDEIKCMEYRKGAQG